MEGPHLGFDELKAEVLLQPHRPDPPLVRGRARRRRRRRRRAPARRSTVNTTPPSAPRMRAPRRAAAPARTAYDGLFVRGAVDRGEIVALYPGVVYGLDALAAHARRPRGWPPRRLQRGALRRFRRRRSLIGGGPASARPFTFTHERTRAMTVHQREFDFLPLSSSSSSSRSSPPDARALLRGGASTRAACAESASAVQRDHPLALAPARARAVEGSI